MPNLPLAEKCGGVWRWRTRAGSTEPKPSPEPEPDPTPTPNLAEKEGVEVEHEGGDELAVCAWSTHSGRIVLHCPEGESPPGLARPPTQAPLARAGLGC